MNTASKNIFIYSSRLHRHVFSFLGVGKNSNVKAAVGDYEDDGDEEEEDDDCSGDDDDNDILKRKIYCYHYYYYFLLLL